MGGNIEDDERVLQARVQGEYSQTQLSGCFLLVIIRTFPPGLYIGIAQHTVRGVLRVFAMAHDGCGDRHKA